MKHRKRPHRETVSFRLLPDTIDKLGIAAAQTDTTLGRYIEKALKAQFRRDGIVFTQTVELHTYETQS
jgi:hypothetical protein